MSDDASTTTTAGARTWHSHWLVRDLTLLVPISLAAVLGGLAISTFPAPVQAQVQQTLTLLAVAGTVAAALAVSFAGRLDEDVTALRIGSGLFVYGGIVLPITTARFGTSIGPVGQVLDVVCLCAVAGLFTLGLFHRGRPTMSWPAAAVAAAGSFAAVACLALFPALLPGRVVLTAIFSAAVAVWSVVGAAHAVIGVQRHSVLMRRFGIGLALLAVAHVGQGPLTVGATMASPVFTGLRPAAVALVLAGVYPHLRDALRRQRSRDLHAALRLRAAEEAGEAAERDADDRAHEMRNLVLGLSGAAALLSDPADRERAELGAAVAAELDRLTRLLDRRTDGHGPGGTVDVHSALATAVTLRRAAGARIRFDVAPGLRATGSAEVLTQVTTNLLVNCARHAPGTAVSVSAAEEDGRVVVRIRDGGPGIARGQEEALLQRGRRSAVTGGSGLGLGISRDLVRAHGGDLRLLRPDDGGPGCLVVIDLAVPVAAVHEPAC